MPREALSHGERRLDAEIDRLWAAIDALRAASAGSSASRAYTEAIVFSGAAPETPPPPPAVAGTIVAAEPDEDPLYQTRGIA